MKIQEIIKQYSTEKEVWTVAIRKRKDTLLHQGNTEGFAVVSGNQRYWIADPFLHSYKGKNYLFVEMYDRLRHKGVIGVSQIVNGKCSAFKVCLELPYHLSYPLIFERDGEIYMLPECAESKRLTVFKSVRYPYRWEAAYDLAEGEYVDTTPIYNSKTKEVQYFTSEYDPIGGGNDNLCLIYHGHDIRRVITSKCVRSAGHIIKDNEMIRPAQDDTDTYGCGLIFYRILDISPDNYQEEKITRICTKGCKHSDDDLELILPQDEKEYIGVHTYNFNDEYEVVDLLVKEQNNIFILWENRQKMLNRIIRIVKRRIKQ